MYDIIDLFRVYFDVSKCFKSMYCVNIVDRCNSMKC